MDLNAIRSLFPVTRRWAYFNHAAVSPLADPTRQAIEAHFADQAAHGAVHLLHWIAALERVRARAAALVGADSSDIALTKNTSEGLNTIAQGLAWRSGDRIVTIESEFPANLYPWLALRPRGVQVELLPETALLDLNRLAEACRGARLLSVSFVQYLSGLRADCAALGSICRDAGALFVVDGIQGLGAFPLDVKTCRIHALATGGQKWLTGPEGAGFLYVSPELLDQLQPPEPGWLSVANALDFEAARRCALGPPELQWRAGAARFECGSMNTAGLRGLGAAITLLMDAGIPAIEQHLLSLGDHLASGLESRGFSLLRPSDDRSRRSGITSFRRPNIDAETLVARLESAGIICSPRSGWVRVSPHLYNTADEIDRLLDAVA